MASSQVKPNSSSAEIRSVSSSITSTSTSKQPSSFQTAPSSLSLRAVSSSATTSAPSATFTSSTDALPSISSSPSQITPHSSTDAQTTPLSHRPTIIAAIAASLAAVLLFTFFAILIWRRRRARRQQLARMTSPHQSILGKPSDDDKRYPDSARFHAGPGWPDEPPAWSAPIPLRLEDRESFSGKTPHYTVRTRASSVPDVYGFGQDLAWQEAHYEDPDPGVDPFRRPTIDVLPPTPPSGVIHHDMAAAPVLRSNSAASSISSAYSTASMVLPDRSAPPDAAGPALSHDDPRDLGTDDRHWLDLPPDVHGSRRLI